jgi:hypothetical protein
MPAGSDVIPMAPVGVLGPAWSPVWTLAYGETDDTLGTAPGGDGGSLDLGPEYGARAPDGTWWLLDTAKSRVVQVDASGRFLRAIPAAPEVRVGPYFPYQLPRVFDDGTFVASRFGPDGTVLLLVDTVTGAMSSRAIGSFVPTTSDGTWLYGYGDDRQILRVRPTAGDVEVTDGLRTRAGTRFELRVEGDRLTVTLPDAEPPVRDELHVVAADDPTVPAHAGIEVASGPDGTLFVLAYGGTDDDATQLGAWFSIAPDGVVSPVETIRDPFSPSDPGSPAHLGATADGVPWLMFVDPDGVRVYERR